MIIAIREDQSVRGDTVAESVESKSSELRRASAGKAKVRNSATPDVEAAVPDSQVEDVSSHKGSQRPEHAGPRHLASAVNRDRWKNSHPAPNEEVIPTIELDSSDNAFQSVPQSSTSSVDYQSKLITSLRSIEPHVLDFRTMANLNIFHLQLELGKMQKEVSDLEENSITPSALDMKRLEDNLHRYTTAIRDYEYMARLEDARFRSAEYGFLHRTFPSAYPDYTRFVNQRRSGDIVFKKCPDRRTPSDPLRDWVKKHLPRSLAWTNEEVTRRYDAYHHFNKSIRDVVSPFVDKFARFIIALTGGLSLVVPMLIMRLQQNSNKSLITTSVAVVLFSGVVSIVFRASNAETLSITAAYAAVLVVFVGTST